MVNISGSVYDYYTNLPVSGINILTFDSSQQLLASGVSNASGIYTISYSNFSGGINTYVPISSGYVGYSRSIEDYVSPIDLIIRNKNYSTDAENINLVDSVLKTSWNVIEGKGNLCNVFVTTDNGLDIIDPNTFSNKGYITISGGFNSLGLSRNECSDSFLYLGTSISGVYRYLIPEEFNQNNQTNSLQLFKQVPDINSNTITALDRNESNTVSVGTISGLDIIFEDNTRYKTQFDNSISSVFLTQSGDVYYSPQGSGLYVKYLPASDWNNPDYVLDLSSTPSLPGLVVNDIEVQTSPSGNYVYLATNSGVFTYWENRNNIASSEVRVYNTSILSGGTNNITGLELNNFSITSGNIFISTFDINTNGGAVQEVDLGASGVVNVFTKSTVESSLRRAGLTVSGSRFIVKI